MVEAVYSGRNEMTPPPEIKALAPSDLLESLRASHELSAIETQNQLRRILSLMQIFTPAIRDAAAAGNVRCKQALAEAVEKGLL